MVVIGLDGADWHVLEPFAAKGELPSITLLAAEGARGKLRSVVPPITGPAWVSFSTGMDPGGHGIFDFVRPDGGRLRLNTPADIRAPSLPAILSGAGLRSVFISMPLSFPPQPGFSGVMFSDFLHPEPEVVPPSASAYLEEYRVTPDFSLRGEKLLDDIVATARARVKTAQDVFTGEDWDFYFLYFHETDSVCHLFWNRVASGDLKALEVFRIADSFIGWVMERVDAGTTVIVVSDHGFGPFRGQVQVNSVLMEHGLVTPRVREKQDEQGVAEVLGLDGGRTQGKGFLARMPEGLIRLAHHPCIRPLSQRAYRSLFRGKGGGVRLEADISSSVAFMPTSESYGVYAGDSCVNREEVVAEVIGILSALRDDRGEKVFLDVLKREAVFSGPYTHLAPDVVLIPGGYHPDASIGGSVTGPFPAGAFHYPDGILIAAGGAVAPGTTIEGARLIDIAPTILEIFGIRPPQRMDGRVLGEIGGSGTRQGDAGGETDRIRSSARSLRRLKL